MPPLSIVTFAPLKESQLAMLYEWLHRPHVATWWDASEDFTECCRELRALTLEESATKGYIALLDDKPLGFIQSYVVAGSGDGWWEQETDAGARGIDQFLCEPAALGKGLGRLMVSAFAAELFADPSVTKIQADPHPNNTRAIRCYASAGFVAAGVVPTPDGLAHLMVQHRPTRE